MMVETCTRSHGQKNTPVLQNHPQNYPKFCDPAPSLFSGLHKRMSHIDNLMFRTHLLSGHENQIEQARDNHVEHDTIVLRTFDLGLWSLLVRFKARALQQMFPQNVFKFLGTLILKGILLLLFSLKQDPLIGLRQFFGSCCLNVVSRSTCSQVLNGKVVGETFATWNRIEAILQCTFYEAAWRQ